MTQPAGTTVNVEMDTKKLLSPKPVVSERAVIFKDSKIPLCVINTLKLCMVSREHVTFESPHYFFFFNLHETGSAKRVPVGLLSRRSQSLV